MSRIITIVSGIPRSGTSMMMRILMSGGMDVLADSNRTADEDNPLGYYEFEKVKRIKEDASWLEGSQGKAFKMVSMLLYDLPSIHDYKIIFMKRNMEEVVASQRRMLERSGHHENGVGDEEMGKLFYKHMNKLMKWIETRENMETLYVSYNDFIENPRKNAEIVNQFLDNRLDVEKMIKSIDASLYRNRADATI